VRLMDEETKFDSLKEVPLPTEKYADPGLGKQGKEKSGTRLKEGPFGQGKEQGGRGLGLDQPRHSRSDPGSSLFGSLGDVPLKVDVNLIEEYGVATQDEVQGFLLGLKRLIGGPSLNLNESLASFVSFYIYNGATEAIQHNIGFQTLGRRITHGQVLGLCAQQGVPLRRIMRAFADLARAVLSANPQLCSKLFKRMRLPDTARIIAFDFADGCSDPPLSIYQLEILREMRRYATPHVRPTTIQTPLEETE